MFVPDNSARAVKEYICLKLGSRYEEREASNIAYLLLGESLGWKKMDVISDSSLRATESELLKIRAHVKRLEGGEPVQYVLRKATFGDLELKVSPAVLIPRPETEEWLYETLKHLPTGAKVLDVGTGSGCIPLFLKDQRPDLEVHSMDVSEEALEVANENARNLNLDVQFFKDDILSPSDEFCKQKWDVIISNPPYIAVEEKEKMAQHVLNHEPHLALFSEGDSLRFYKAIANYAKGSLNENGLIFLEVNERLGDEVLVILRDELGVEGKVFKDLQGKDRMVWGAKKKA